MAKISLRRAIEDYGMELCRHNALLKGKKKFHADSANDAEATCLVFKAAVGERDLSGVPHFHVQLEIEWRNEKTGPDQNDLIVAAIYDAFLSATRGATTAENHFLVGNGFLIREDEMSSDRRDTNNLRVSIVTIPFRARLADDLSSTTERG